MIMKVCLSNTWLKVLCIKTEIIHRINKAKSSAFNKQAMGRGGVTFTLSLPHSLTHTHARTHTHKHTCTHSLSHSFFFLSLLLQWPSCCPLLGKAQRHARTHACMHARTHTCTHTHTQTHLHSLIVLSLSPLAMANLLPTFGRSSDTQAQERAMQTTQILDSSGCCKTI